MQTCIEEFYSLPLICSKEIQQILNKKLISPAAIFEKLHVSEMKLIVRRSLKDLAGIYMRINKANEKCYIGSATTGKFYSRFYKHLFMLTPDKPALPYGGSKLVGKAVKKYGLDKFAFVVITIFPEITTSDNVDKLLELETFFIKKVKPEYNILQQAGNTLGYKHTEKDKIRMREIYSTPRGVERREKIGSLNRGKSLSKETIEKIRKFALKRAPISPETRAKCVTNQRNIVISKLDGSNQKFFANVVLAASFINCNSKTIRRALKGNGIVKRQWKVVDSPQK
jgi:group I intron endonuclease